jgi:GDP/UDP-N,N'-diacetylbacillosamine 2-epimerase (hydrolysing)
MSRKICIITGSRAEYGLLYFLMKEIQQDPELELSVIATGMHLSAEFGSTYKEIEKDGFTIDAKPEILLSSDSPVAISKSMGLAMISMAEAYEKIKPDLIVGLGDRFELMAAIAAACVCCIPVAHIHGGEITEGAIDEAFRHSITKMSQLHFTATEAYRKRVIQLGEQPERVYNFGGLGVDSIKQLKLLGKEELERSLEFKLGAKNIVVTFHPVTLEHEAAAEQFKALLDALDEQEDTHIFITRPNADTGSRVLLKMIDEYAANRQDKVRAYTSLGQLRYFSLLQFADVMVGNSSSGIIEMPSFKKATVNIGDRQKGRSRAESIIDCEPDRKSVSNAIKLALSPAFREKIKGVKNPYGEGGASKKIKQVLKEVPLNGIIRKQFYDINF